MDSSKFKIQSLIGRIWSTIEERVSYLEGKVEEHTRSWQDIRDLIFQQGGRINNLEGSIDRLVKKIVHRFINLGQKIYEINMVVSSFRLY